MGKKIAATDAIIMVKIIVRVPSDMQERTGILAKRKLSAKHIGTKTAITRFVFTGGIITAKNIP